MGLSPEDTPHSTCAELPSISSDENMNGEIFGGSAGRETVGRADRDNAARVKKQNRPQRQVHTIVLDKCTNMRRMFAEALASEE